MISLLLWACPAKKIPEVPVKVAESPPETPAQDHSDKSDDVQSASPAPFAGRQQTETLLTQGILDPLPAQTKVGTPVIVQFRTLYRNGCWSQSEPEHQIAEQTITHSYTTTFASDSICTMALLPGGFQTEITLSEIGQYEGRIIVDGTEKASYSLQVVAAD